jgi:hypothetical protein
MGGAPQVAMRVASQIWHIVFASQTLQVFRLALRKKAQYVVVHFLPASGHSMLAHVHHSILFSFPICKKEVDILVPFHVPHLEHLFYFQGINPLALRLKLQKPNFLLKQNPKDIPTNAYGRN